MTYTEEIERRNFVNDLGSSPFEDGKINRLDSFAGNGSQTAFVLTAAPTTSVFVYVSTILKLQTTDYSISGATITFVTAPANGTLITVRYAS